MAFAVLIPLIVASLAFAWIAALTLRLDRSRRALERLAHQDPLITPAGPQSLTASFGLAARREGESIGALITRADNALYAAKQAGRNRTQTAA